MQIATWNVNSLRVRLPQLLDWLGANQPDIVALQETKVLDEAFPAAEIAAAGYQVAFNGQKTYNGVAILARTPLSESVLEIPSFDDQQRRVLAVSCGGVRVVNLYVPNGQSIASDKYEYKLRWLQGVAAVAARRAGAVPAAAWCWGISTLPRRIATCTTRRPGPARCW